MPANDLILRYCNCAECGRSCLGEKTWATILSRQPRGQSPPRSLHVAGRISERPWCNDCLTPGVARLAARAGTLTRNHSRQDAADQPPDERHQ